MRDSSYSNVFVWFWIQLVFSVKIYLNALLPFGIPSHSQDIAYQMNGIKCSIAISEVVNSWPNEVSCTNALCWFNWTGFECILCVFVVVVIVEIVIQNGRLTKKCNSTHPPLSSAIARFGFEFIARQIKMAYPVQSAKLLYLYQCVRFVLFILLIASLNCANSYQRIRDKDKRQCYRCGEARSNNNKQRNRKNSE